MIVMLIMLSACHATDNNNLNETKHSDPTYANTWKKATLVSKFDEISNQVDLDVEHKNDNYKIFLENKELSPSPSKSVKIYFHSDSELSEEEFVVDKNTGQNDEEVDKSFENTNQTRPEKLNENQLSFITSYNNQMQNKIDRSDFTSSTYSSFVNDTDAHMVIDHHIDTYNVDKTVSVLQKYRSPITIRIPKLNVNIKIQKFWNNLSEETQLRILASVCCPCVFIRYFPDLLTFILWLIFYIASKIVCSESEDDSSVSCVDNTNARDITGTLWIILLIIRIIIKANKQYEYRPRKIPNWIDRV